jgi:hypothetical protein
MTRADLLELMPAQYVDALLRKYGGKVVWLPVLETKREHRDRAIVEDLETANYREAGEANGVSERTAKRAGKRCGSVGFK